jgi:trans-AT polyketide synthase/acyltransferase/oxidoreductase domain-containing protein
MFPGQGSQFIGMGENLFKEFPKEVKDASDVLGYDIVDLCLRDSKNQLNQTNFTQPAIFFVNYLSYQKFLEENPAPQFLIGHSLGEFNALCSSGVFDMETGLKIVQKRGELMYSVSGTTMAAVIGASYDEIRQILDTHFPDIDVANINSPSQVVISGKIDSLEKAADFIEDEGFAYVPLKVSGAFHSRYMTPVKAQFEAFVSKMTLNRAHIPVISNYTARPYPFEKEGVIANIVNQIDNPIKWLQSIEFLIEQTGCDFKEIGPGEVLSNLLKKIKAY